jgi:hypothetical protein
MINKKKMRKNGLIVISIEIYLATTWSYLFFLYTKILFVWFHLNDNKVVNQYIGLSLYLFRISLIFSWLKIRKLFISILNETSKKYLINYGMMSTTDKYSQRIISLSSYTEKKKLVLAVSMKDLFLLDKPTLMM